MKKLFMLLAGVSFSIASAQITMSQSMSDDIVPGGVSCGNSSAGYTSFNSFSRGFEFADYGITEDFEVSSVTFALEEITGTLDFSLVIGGTDSYPWDEVDYLGFETMSVSPGDAGVVLEYTFDNPVLVPSSYNTLVFAYEADGEDVLISFFPGSNSQGETADSYIYAPACGLDAPATFGSVGFPDVHLVMSVTGDLATMGTVELGSKSLSVYPNPATDVVNIKLGDNKTVQSVEIVNLAGQSVFASKSLSETVNVNFLAPGVYVVRVKDNNGVTHMQKLVKK